VIVVNRSLRFSIAAAAAVGAAAAGIATAASSADPPANRTLPSIAGVARVGRVLSVRNGGWAGTRPLAFAYQWRRCGSGGGNCVDIAGATAKTYAATSAEVGHRLRALVTAKNADGSSSAVSRPSAVVAPRSNPAPPPPPPPTGPAGQIRLADGKVSIPVTSVSPPQRLVISAVSFSPNPVRSRTPFTGRFRVTDTRGYAVRGALVFALGVPYNRILQEPEQATGTDGYATFTFRPTASLPLAPGGALVVFLRARKASENLLAGVSTRRLVQVNLG
jgi:hypothetical protein